MVSKMVVALARATEDKVLSRIFL